MDSNEFREFGQASIEFIINYLENIRERNVLPTTTPLSLVQSLPQEIPEQAEHWKTILHDLKHIILPGLTHWQSPHFHAYFPSSSSAGSIVGELLIAGIGVLGFSWVEVHRNKLALRPVVKKLKLYKLMKQVTIQKYKTHRTQRGENVSDATHPYELPP